MRSNTARALYGLAIDAFMMGLADEAPQPQAFSLSEKEATNVRKDRYADRIKAMREGKAA
jgi:hypothetical protein